VLVEEPLPPKLVPRLEAAIHALIGARLSVTISFPGEAGEDASLVGLVKGIAGVTYCPSTSARMYGGHALPGIRAMPESVRLYGTARFQLVIMVGRCRYYRRLLGEFPPSARSSIDLRDAGSLDALRMRLAAPFPDPPGTH
jgi:hypothetical protein